MSQQRERSRQSDSVGSAFADLIAEITDRLQAGEPLDLEEHIAAHPEWAERLRNMRPALEVMAEARSASGGLSSAELLDAEGEPIRGTLGDFRIVREVGKGGMGVVYEAEQISLKRRVALKVLPFAATMDARHLQRFRNEAQAAASLHHTNIVPVHFVGCERGVHYYAMQFIEGRNLADVIAYFRQQAEGKAPAPEPANTVDAAEGQALSPAASRADTRPIAGLSTEHSAKSSEYFRTVARLGIQAGEALDHAHQIGIVHRDIKPANMLVDADGRLWVTDFGLAQFQSDARLTMTGDLVGTLRYMSPEQALAKRVVIDHRTDVYSLGATLYELLTLEPAFEGRDREELLRQIAFEEPKRARRCNKAIPQELETIVLKAMERNPADRYATAQELADDLERFVKEEPIRAKKPSVAQRARKWVRRHKVVVRSAVAVLAVTLLASVISTVLIAGAYQSEAKARAAEKVRADSEAKAKEEAERDRDAKEKALRKEEQERKYAQAVADFVQYDFLALTSVEGQLRFGDEGDIALGKDATLRQLLDRAAVKLDQRRGLDPRIEGDLRWMIGVNYRALGEADLAIPFLERCVALRKELFGSDHEATLNAQNSLAIAYDNAGKLNLALPLLEETLKLRKIKLGPDHLETLASMCNLAYAYETAGKLDLAVSLGEDALKISKEKLGENHAHTLRIMECLATAYQNAGKLDIALSLFEETLTKLKAEQGYDHPDTLRCMNNLAGAYKHAGELDIALSLFKETLKQAKVKFGPDHPDTIRSMHNLGVCYYDARKLDLALPLLEDSLKLFTVKLGADHLMTLTNMDNLALAYSAAGRRDLALSHFEKNLKMRNIKLGADHPDTLTSMHHLASAYQDARELDLAIPLYEESLKLRRIKLGSDHPDTLLSMNDLASAYGAARKPDLALPLLEEIAAGMERKRFQDRNAGLAVGNVVACHEQLKQYHEAEAWRRKWLAVVKDRAGADSLLFANELAPLGLNLFWQNKWSDAEVVLRDCLAIREKKQPDLWNTFTTRSMLGCALLNQKKYADAEPLLLQGYEGMKQRADTIPAQVRALRLTEAVERLVQLYEANGNKDEAVKWQKELETLKKP
jgi:serine/threonine protein kinase